MKSPVLIEPARRADYASLLALNADAVPNVNLIDEPTLAALHEQATALLTARDPEGALAGFLLALPESADYASVNFRFFQQRFSGFVYVDRIVVSERHRRLGVGAALYGWLFDQLGDRRVTCEVNVEPPNPGSMAFHARLGFSAVGEQDTEGGRKRVALLVREAKA